MSKKKTLLYMLLFCIVSLVLCFLTIFKASAQTTKSIPSIDKVDKLYVNQYNKWNKVDTAKIKLVVQATNDIPFNTKLQIIDTLLLYKQSQLYQTIVKAQKEKAKLFFYVPIIFVLLLILTIISSRRWGELITFVLFILTILAFAISIYAVFKGYYIYNTPDMEVIRILKE